jgi:ribonucleoside-diphosphate reductase alpha chain
MDDEDVYFDWDQFVEDIYPIHRMMDNVIDRTVYPLPEQEAEAKNKRRMGIGITGVANAADFLGLDYGSEDMLYWLDDVLRYLRNHMYLASIGVAKEKGPFPLFDKEKYLEGEFIKSLPYYILEDISKYGIRNSHLLSIAPTGTISLWARNVSSGIEPVFSLEYVRKVYMPSGEQREFLVQDYAYSEWGLEGKTSNEITAKQHINVLCLASRYVDSSCSKTCNVGDNVTFEEFKNLYMMAYEGGAKGCTTFRPAGLRKGVLTETKLDTVSGPTCEIDSVTGEKSCAD